MKAIINQLVQLQELHLSRREQEAGTPGADLKQLDDSIAEMMASLPPEVETQFSRLLQKNPLAIVPAVEGTDKSYICTGCGMKLPISLKPQVVAAGKICTCPSCARILFHSEGSARNIRKRGGHRTAPKVGIERFSVEELMIPSLKAADRKGVVLELAARMRDAGFVDNADKLAEDALSREAIVSTSVGNGVAFPHVRCVEGGALTLALGLSPEGVAFDAAHPAEKTHIFFFMVIPTAASAFYLKLLAGLSGIFQEEAARRKILDCTTSAALWKTLVALTKKALS